MATGKSTAQPMNTAPHWRDRPRDVPAPGSTAIREQRPQTAALILAEAQRQGRAPADFLADLVWIGWQAWQERAIQAGSSSGLVG